MCYIVEIFYKIVWVLCKVVMWFCGSIASVRGIFNVTLKPYVSLTPTFDSINHYSTFICIRFRISLKMVVMMSGNADNQQMLQFTTNITVSDSEKPRITFCDNSCNASYTLLTPNTRIISCSGVDVIRVIIWCRMVWARRVVSIYADISRPLAENSDFRCDRDVSVCSTLTWNESVTVPLILKSIGLVFRRNPKQNHLVIILVRKNIYIPSVMTNVWRDGIYLNLISSWPITVAAGSKAWNVFAHSNMGIMESNLTQGMDVCLRLFCFFSPL
jgi:hypothetical protein